jgi:hydrogenase nickel incorporation protein HypA/HybF
MIHLIQGGGRAALAYCAAMHEMGLAAEAYGIARRAADASGGGALESVTVVVGELSAVEPDLLRFAWEALLSGTPDASARLDVEWRPARQRCARCGDVAERAAGSWLRLCPRCGGALAVSGGDELEVRTVAFAELTEAS